MKKYTVEELEEFLRVDGTFGDDRAPSSDQLAEALQKIAPYLKIRFCRVGYFSDAEGNPKPADEGERWGATIDGEDSDYNWCASLWESLAYAYLRITKTL